MYELTDDFPDEERFRLTNQMRRAAVSISSNIAEGSSRASRMDFARFVHALPFGRLWYGEPNAISNAIDYVEFYSRSHRAVIRVYDEAGNVIDTHDHIGDFKEW